MRQRMKHGGFVSCALWLLLAGCGDDGASRSGDPASVAPSGDDADLDAGVAGAADGGRREGGPVLIAPDDPPARDASTRADARVPSESSASAPWLIQPGGSVFFIGNSFFGWQDRILSEWVVAIGQAVAPPFPIQTGEYLVPGNNKLAWFFEQAESRQAIESGKYELFVVMAEEHEPVDDEAGFREAVRDYKQAIEARGGRMLLFMTWGFDWDPDGEWFKRLASVTEKVGRELDVPIIPAGLIHKDCNEQPFGKQRPYWLLNSDGHQNGIGSAANAYATFAMVTGKNPMGAPIRVRENDSSPELLRYLSDKAWARVMTRLSASAP